MKISKSFKSISKLVLIFSLAFPAPQMVWANNATLVFDVSGKQGQKDSDGQSYDSDAGRDGDGSGRDGRDGGHAVENQDKDGEHAGHLYLNLSYQQAQTGATVGVDGQMVRPGKNIRLDARQSVQAKAPLNPQTSISLLAVGGRGGDGGLGGKGQDGGDGENGRDAYHSGHSPVPGTDGKPGGDGGNAGDPTDGGHAGNGGEIHVGVSIFDTDLAMLLERVVVSGNKGGEKGRSLGPGQGGSGGRGGASDSISWQEKTGQEDIVVTEDVTNSEGEVIGTRSVKTGTRDIMTSRSSFAPGGNDGSSGSSGRSSHKMVHHGQDSQSGKFKFVVTDENGKKQEYDGPYNLVLQPDYQLEGDLNKSGFFEPGETINIKGLKVTNSGQSPTPKHQKILLFVSDNSGWIRSKSVEIEVPEVLNPGESHLFTKETISFNLAEKPRTKPGPLETKDQLIPQARVTRVEREFKGFSDGAHTQLQIRYPLEITPLSGMTSLSAGEIAKVLFKVKNVSSQTIGGSGKDSLRLAHAKLARRGGSTDANEFFFLQKPDGEFVDSTNGMVQALSGLKPNEEVVVEALMGLGRNPKAFTDVEVYPELYLESLLKKGQSNLVQFNPFKLRVSQTFKRTENADVLLIANHSLNDQVLDALRYTAKVKNLVMDIWDFSYYGFFNLNQSIEGWESFFAAYRNKTIIVMGNQIETPVGRQTVQGLLSPDDVIKAGRRFGIRFFIIDSSKDGAQESVARMTAPVQTGESTNQYSTIKQYVRELETEVKKFDEIVDGDKDQDLGVSEVQVSKRMLWWQQPTIANIHEKAETLLKKSRQIAPEASLFVDYTFAPTLTSKFWGKKFKLGSLKISRSVDTSRTSVVATHVSEPSLQDPAFIMSPEFQTAFDMGIHIDTKLNLISSILSGSFVKAKDIPEEFAKLNVLQPEEFAKLLLNSVLAEIIHEQMQIRPLNFTSKLSKDTVWHKLDILTRVANFSYNQTELDPSTAEGKMWMEFIVELKRFSVGIVTTGERIYSNSLGFIFGKSKNYQISEVTDELINRLITGVFHDALIPDLKKTIAAEVKSRGQLSMTSQRAAQANQRMAYQPTRNGDVYTTAASRIRSPEDFAQAVTAGTRRDAREAEIRMAFAAKSADLKLSHAQCEEILNRRAR